MCYMNNKALTAAPLDQPLDELAVVQLAVTCTGPTKTP